MKETNAQAFDDFATRFVERYWEAVAVGLDDMPPNEPCEQTLEELLAEVDHQTSCDETRSPNGCPLYSLRMTSILGDEWIFGFQEGNMGKWTLVSAFAINVRERLHSDLLVEPYSRSFKPFLDRIVELAAP